MQAVGHLLDAPGKAVAVANLLWTIITILFVLWLLGFILHFGGSLIHLVLVVAVILLVFNILTGRGARV